MSSPRLPDVSVILICVGLGAAAAVAVTAAAEDNIVAIFIIIRTSTVFCVNFSFVMTIETKQQISGKKRNILYLS